MAEHPPVAPIHNVVENHHGTTIIDPYRYMEDFKSPLVQDWVRAQAEFTDKTIHALHGRDALLARIIELDAGTPYTISNITCRPNGDLFYFKQLASENVAKVYLRDGKTNQERLLIDPETFPKTNAADHYTISFIRVSPNGSQLLYGFAASGSEETTLKVFDLPTNQDLPIAIDRLEAEYALPSWFSDGKSFAYSRRRKVAADAPPTEGYKFTQAYRYPIGDSIDQATMIFADRAAGSPAMGEMDFPAVIIPAGSTWAIGQIRHGDETDISLYVTPQSALGSPDTQWVKICDRTDQVTSFAVRGDDIYLLSAHNAPRFKVMRTSLREPNLAKAATIVPAGEYVVDSLAVAQDALYVDVLKGVANQVLRIPFENNAAPEFITLPADEPSGTVAVSHPEMPGVMIRTSSWTKSSRLYRYDPLSGSLAETGLQPPGKYDSPDFLTSVEVMVTSHDGVQVPLSIIHRKDIRQDGSNPTLLSGYGAYGFTMPMRYDPISLAWLERGGVLAFAHVRGGGAFGKEWHHAGRKHTKPNTWKDFIACGEYLVQKGYTSPAKLAGKGGSAGGILIGRSITERPDLFAAAQISVGCTDMMRFESTMNGPPNIPEFGTITKADEFRGLLAMSTFHHIQDGVKYPAVILTHGINDPRVEPWISAKATARLQAATASGKPVLFRVDYHSGHGIGSTKKQRQVELADVYSFLLWQFGDPSFQAD
ncbi:MAG: prolyl oligopeptidase family serine peptidase [Pirellulales bacterium]|nr:prolyl oligopeptidase family serine peptidase [Pirellulales bacterium]